MEEEQGEVNEDDAVNPEGQQSAPSQDRKNENAELSESVVDDQGETGTSLRLTGTKPPGLDAEPKDVDRKGEHRSAEKIHFCHVVHKRGAAFPGIATPVLHHLRGK